MADRGKEWIFNCISRNSEAPHVWSFMLQFSVWAIPKGMVVVPIRLVVYHTPLVCGRNVAQSVVVERNGIRPLPVPVWHRLPFLLFSSINVRVEEPVACQYTDHRSHCKRCHPPVVVRRTIPYPSMEPLFIEEICNCWICLVFEEDRVSLAEAEG